MKTSIIKYMQDATDSFVNLDRIPRHHNLSRVEGRTKVYGLTDIAYLETAVSAFVDYTKSIKCLVEQPFEDAVCANVRTSWAGVTAAMDVFVVEEDEELHLFDMRKTFNLERLTQLTDTLVACASVWYAYNHKIQEEFDHDRVLETLFEITNALFSCIRKFENNDLIAPDEQVLEKFPVELVLLSEPKYFTEEEVKEQAIREEQQRRAEEDHKREQQEHARAEEHYEAIAKFFNTDRETIVPLVSPRSAMGVRTIIESPRMSLEDFRAAWCGTDVFEIFLDAKYGDITGLDVIVATELFNKMFDQHHVFRYNNFGRYIITREEDGDITLANGGILERMD